MNTLRKRIGTGEFAWLVALLTSYQALCTFALLPALPQIAVDLSVANQNDAQLVIGLFLVGNMIGQLLFGPLSDAFGRKPVIVSGLAIFFLGCLISLATNNFWILLFGRVLQGLGAAAPRTVSLSMVRDLYSGRPMARLMSLAMGIFTVMPIIAPMLGQATMHIAGWRGILSAFILFGVLGLLWLQIRQVESLVPENRRRLQAKMYIDGFVSVWENRAALIYSFALGTTFAAFVGLTSSVQQIFQDTFGVGESFPYLFAAMSFSVVIASLLNSRIVIHFGMRKIVKLAMISIPAVSLVYLAICLFFFDPGLFGFITWGAFCFFGIGMSFANVNTLAMAPLGHIAGLGAAVVSFIPASLAVLIGIPLGRTFDGTQLPLVTGFTVLGVMGLALVLWADRYPQKPTK